MGETVGQWGWGSGREVRGGGGRGRRWIVSVQKIPIFQSLIFLVSISFVHKDQRELDIGWGFLFDFPFAWRGIGSFVFCKFPACWLLEACLE